MRPGPLVGSPLPSSLFLLCYGEWEGGEEMIPHTKSGPTVISDRWFSLPDRPMAIEVAQPGGSLLSLTLRLNLRSYMILEIDPIALFVKVTAFFLFSFCTPVTCHPAVSRVQTRVGSFLSAYLPGASFCSSASLLLATSLQPCPRGFSVKSPPTRADSPI